MFLPRALFYAVCRSSSRMEGTFYVTYFALFLEALFSFDLISFIVFFLEGIYCIPWITAWQFNNTCNVIIQFSNLTVWCFRYMKCVFLRTTAALGEEVTCEEQVVIWRKDLLLSDGTGGCCSCPVKGRRSRSTVTVGFYITLLCLLCRLVHHGPLHLFQHKPQYFLLTLKEEFGSVCV